ncbi:hypothetical protein KFD70_05120 [Bacillus pfraonensis]|uniref:hypothetical protein n=1 Tax=Bacillus TaxID=1386 RepID=UPI002A57CB4E|nr:hypothetical protein [Bacillus pseudomycoides]
MNEIPITIHLDDAPFQLKEYQGFDWLVRLGRVVAVFDQRDSANIYFGIEKKINAIRK